MSDASAVAGTSDPAVETLIKDLETSGEGRLIEPIDRISEVLFGLFMVLTFTGTMSVAGAGREDVKLMLVAAIGCNIAWGFVDGVMYVLRTLVARAREATFQRAVRATREVAVAYRLIASQIGPVAASLDAPALERVRQWIADQAPPLAGRVRMKWQDLRGALVVFMLVFASTFPPVLPFIFVDDMLMAKRASGALAIMMLFLCGYGWGRYGGLSPWRAGLVMVMLGLAVEAIVIALGG
jgi:VIT1/CCC1 family predicted Fe2+/Mn2+ transporter